VDETTQTLSDIVRNEDHSHCALP